MLDSCSLAASYKVTYLGCVTSTTGALTTTLQTNNLIGRGNGGGEQALPQMKFSCLRLAELRTSVSGGRFELSKVPVTEGKTRGNPFCFKLEQDSSYRKTKVL